MKNKVIRLVALTLLLTLVPAGVVMAAAKLEWKYVDGKWYWYENDVKQGMKGDPKNIIDDKYGGERGREIYDPESNGWYWLDAVYDGAKAADKEVWMPYIYQNERSWTEEQIEKNAAASGTMSEQVKNAIHNHSGKWVRYDPSGRMIKNWYKVQGRDAQLYPSQVGNMYYYDPKTGLMAKGWTDINGIPYYFDEKTGALKYTKQLMINGTNNAGHYEIYLYTAFPYTITRKASDGSKQQEFTFSNIYIPSFAGTAMSVVYSGSTDYLAPGAPAAIPFKVKVLDGGLNVVSTLPATVDANSAQGSCAMNLSPGTYYIMLAP